MLSLEGEALAQLCRLRSELVRLEDLVRHHHELKLEEVAGLRVCMLLRFVDLRPDLPHVLVDHSFDGLEGHALVVITQHEEKLLGR